jgi:hypothetical protein
VESDSHSFVTLGRISFLSFHWIGIVLKMAESREETPSTSWQTETEGSGDDDMDFEVRQP